MKLSINPLTQKQYKIPESLDDIENINDFLSNIRTRK